MRGGSNNSLALAATATGNWRLWTCVVTADNAKCECDADILAQLQVGPLQVKSCALRVASRELRVASCEFRVAARQLP